MNAGDFASTYWLEASVWCPDSPCLYCDSSDERYCLGSRSEGDWITGEDLFVLANSHRASLGEDPLPRTSYLGEVVRSYARGLAGVHLRRVRKDARIYSLTWARDEDLTQRGIKVGSSNDLRSRAIHDARFLARLGTPEEIAAFRTRFDTPSQGLRSTR